MTEKVKVDTKEFELPETEYIRDIDNRVFQGIILQTLAKIPGISLLEGNFIDHIFGRSEGVKGIHTEQDPKTCSISAKVEVAIGYGLSIPDKAEEIQTKVVQELVKMTGLRVSHIHVVFKELIPPDNGKKSQPAKEKITHTGDYSDIF
ncbi:MAG: Asp23/Gls24 family envelope stress response protein [Verrucomicrobia bacterium]|nr:Asp23/Gls24 family envelope stress response protein [Verrucomicrobiota bacterium]MBS0636022.1 Asp23/Gls24 family envelope stress response protein [Verrucomicrobiota bacterium]